MCDARDATILADMAEEAHVRRYGPRPVLDQHGNPPLTHEEVCGTREVVIKVPRGARVRIERE